MIAAAWISTVLLAVGVAAGITWLTTTTHWQRRIDEALDEPEVGIKPIVRRPGQRVTRIVRRRNPAPASVRCWMLPADPTESIPIGDELEAEWRWRKVLNDDALHVPTEWLPVLEGVCSR